LESEWFVLPKLSSHLPLPIPIPRWKGSPTPRFPWPFLGYKILPGLTACYANLSEEERETLAQPIARFLSSLHAPSLVSVAECQSFEKRVSHLHWEDLIPKTLQNFEEMSRLFLLEHGKELESVVERLQDVRSPSSSAVVHGDFYVRHLLVDTAHHLCGVIDWGDMHLGDPAADLSIAHSFLPLRSHDTFRNAYGEISEGTWALALLRAIYSSTSFALYGYHSRDQAILREALRSLGIMKDGASL
jgi:aminoglycoside phosphotransferase (APT) family kinase protein